MSRLRRVVAYAAGDRVFGAAPLHWVHYRLEHRPHDINYIAHMDSFQSTIKAFYFESVVALEHGPFHFVPGSQRNTHEKLALVHDLVRRGELGVCRSPRVVPHNESLLYSYAPPRAFPVPAKSV
eukprot:6298725-Prymnesium_polylepis.1